MKRALASILVLGALSSGALANRRPMQAMQRQNNAPALKEAAYLKKVQARTRLLSKWVMEGKPSTKGEVDLLAAYIELLPVKGIQQREIRDLRYGENGSHAGDRSQRIRVTGVKDGIYRGHGIGIVSTHDLSSLSWKDFAKTVKQRISGDDITISYDYGPGTTRHVLAAKVPSQAATAIPVEVPLNKSGMTRVIYDRIDRNGGPSGRADAYVGRVVEIEWDGK